MLRGRSKYESNPAICEYCSYEWTTGDHSGPSMTSRNVNGESLPAHSGFILFPIPSSRQ